MVVIRTLNTHTHTPAVCNLDVLLLSSVLVGMMKRLVVSFLQRRGSSSSTTPPTSATAIRNPAVVVVVAPPTTTQAQFSRVLPQQVEPTVVIANKRVVSQATATSTLQQQQHQQRQVVLEEEDSSYSALLGRIWGGVLSGVESEELGLRRVLSSSSAGDGMMRGVATKVAQSINQQSNSSANLSHPFMATAGDLFFGTSCDVVTPGALVLLVERALNPVGSINSSGCVSLARAVVKTCGGYLIHRTVGEGLSDWVHQGNKLATLTGDLLVISLIKDVAETRSNKVLELTMESLSEFSVGEVAGRRAFRETPATPTVFTFDLPSSSGCDLAESWVVARGLESVGVLLTANTKGQCDPELSSWLSELGSGLGTLWKVHYDLMGIVVGGGGGGSVLNRREMQQFAVSLGGDLEGRVVRRGVELGFIGGDCPAVGAVRSLIQFWVGSIVSSRASSNSE